MMRPAACFAALLLAGCGSDPEQLPVLGMARDAVQSTRAAPAAQPKDLGLTRAYIATLSAPVDLVTIERVGAQGVIARIATNGGVETWSSVDNKTLGLRQGIVTATRGLGADLISASVPSPGQVASDGGHHRRSHVVLGPDDAAVAQVYDCRVSLVGPETVSFVERSYQTRHFQEACSSPMGGFRNDYWFQIGGKLRQSRQFVSDDAGYVLIKHLSD